MRLVGRGSLLLGAIALLGVVVFAGCQNPLDPLDESDKIEGLSYIGFSAVEGAWNSDPGNDGLIIAMDYHNEFGDGLSFHDKPHDVIIELWTQVSEGEPAFETKGELIFSRTIRYSNSDDDIRIPIEAYYQQIQPFGVVGTGGGVTYSGFVVVRVHPPQDYPRPELLVAEPGVTFWTPPEAEDTPQ